MIYVQGVGSEQNGTACIMSAARIMSGEASEADTRSDSCSRVCPVVRRFAIGVNDWPGWSDDAERTKYLGPLTVGLIDTVGPTELQQRRAFYLTDVAVRQIAPIALDAVGRRESASQLRALFEIVDKETAITAAAAADAAAYNAAATYAAAAAAAAAATYAAANAAAAAAAATYAAAAADRMQIRDIIVSALDAICGMK